MVESYNNINHIKNKGNEHSNSSNSNYFTIFYYYVCVGDYLLIWYRYGGDLTYNPEPCRVSSKFCGSLKTTAVGAFTPQRLENTTNWGRFRWQKSQRSFEWGKRNTKNDQLGRRD